MYLKALQILATANMILSAMFFVQSIKGILIQRTAEINM